MRTALLFGLLVVGCADQGEVVLDVDVDLPDEVAPGVVYWNPNEIYDDELQGRFLLGSVPDGLTDVEGGANYLSVARKVMNYVDRRASVNANDELIIKTVGGATVHSGVDVVLDPPLELESAAGFTVRITGATNTGVNGYGFVYNLEYKDSTDTTAQWVPYCESGEVAVAMQGVWTSTRFHKTTTDITFGCRDGVTHKCFTWGYRAGRAPLQINQPSGMELHQACTRMASADICGDGKPHTREETPIVIRDLVTFYNPGPGDAPAFQHSPPMPAPPDLYFYESAWTSGENIGAVCLEKQRWASLPVGFSCPGVNGLKDPRTTPDTYYCSNMPSDIFEGKHPWLVNMSMTYDLYLHRWLNPKTNDVVSTVRGYHSMRQSENEVPFTDYTVHLGTDGILLRNMPGSLIDEEVVEVFSTELPAAAGTTDRVLLPNDKLERDDSTFEGYLLKKEGGDRVPFNLYRTTAGDDLTSVDPKDIAFKFQSTMYYVITP